MADLKTYREKRNFRRTPEPEGHARESVADRAQFVVQKHDARRLHYDFRLEHDGVLKSWAVPKGPSLDPKERRLAVQTEDHPLEYATFEGVIPEREYGGGAVLVWDRGYWIPEADPDRALAKGKLDFALQGEKLRGRWTLVRMPPRGERRAEKDNWLLIKRRDREARPADSPELVDIRPESVLTGRDIETVATARDRVWHSNGGESEPTRMPEVGQPGTVPGARRAALPAKAGVQLPTRVNQVPNDLGWFHEPKLAGNRMLCRVKEGAVTLRSPDEQGWTNKLPSVAAALGELPCESALLDGEVVAFDERGVTDRKRLEQAIADAPDEVVLVVFDLLYLDGWDLRGAALRSRKELLRLLVAGAPAAVRYGDHIEGRGADFYREACRLDLEGVISKRADAPYRGGRSNNWVVAPC